MSMDAGDDSDFTDELVGVNEYIAPAPTKKEFFPWHRPRKQFVREKQWCAQIEKLLDDNAGLALDNGTLTYCGLPGSDLLDLRCFHDLICAPRSMKLRFLGFNSAAAPQSSEQVELNISLDEITKLKQIDPESEVIPDDIRTVANTNSIAWSKMSKFGPFDVVNLDLCDSLAAEEVGLFKDNYYNAVARLMGLQFRKKTPWLLLLTTRVGNNHVHSETLKRFSECYIQNLKGCAPFQKESTDTFNIANEDNLIKALETATGFHQVFLTGICKWLLAMAAGHHSSVEVKSVLGYRVEKSAEETDLVSLAIRFIPHPVPVYDPFKLATVTSSMPDECALSVKVLKRISSHRDVDALIASNQDIYDSMAENMAQLLEAARYDVGAYKEWINDRG